MQKCFKLKGLAIFLDKRVFIENKAGYQNDAPKNMLLIKLEQSEYSAFHYSQLINQGL